MSADHRLPGPIVWAMGGAIVAVLGFLLPQWWLGATAMRFSDDVPFIAVGIVSLYAQRVMHHRTHAARLIAAVAVAGLGAVSVGLAAYWLYASGRPELLAARFARRLMDDMAHAAELNLHAASWLDPIAQAVQLAASVLFVGFLIGSFCAFRARIAQRPRPL